MSKIISAFAGLGKTYLANQYDNIVDLDLQKYKYILNDNEDNYEELKNDEKNSG